MKPISVKEMGFIIPVFNFSCLGYYGYFYKKV